VCVCVCAYVCVCVCVCVQVMVDEIAQLYVDLRDNSGRDVWPREEAQVWLCVCVCVCVCTNDVQPGVDLLTPVCVCAYVL
jgi:hypothetical protein